MPRRGERRVKNAIGHLGTSVIDVITNRPTFGIGFNTLLELEFEDAGHRRLSPLANRPPIVCLGLFERQRLTPTLQLLNHERRPVAAKERRFRPIVQ
jgi:hypothetical protein